MCFLPFENSSAYSCLFGCRNGLGRLDALSVRQWKDELQGKQSCDSND